MSIGAIAILKIMIAVGFAIACGVLVAFVHMRTQAHRSAIQEWVRTEKVEHGAINRRLDKHEQEIAIVKADTKYTRERLDHFSEQYSRDQERVERAMAAQLEELRKMGATWVTTTPTGYGS